MVEFRKWYKRQSIIKKKSYSRERIDLESRIKLVLDEMDMYYISKKFSVNHPTWEQLKESKITFPFWRAKTVSKCGLSMFHILKTALISNTGYTRNNKDNKSFNFFITKEHYKKLKNPIKKNE